MTADFFAYCIRRAINEMDTDTGEHWRPGQRWNQTLQAYTDGGAAAALANGHPPWSRGPLGATTGLSFTLPSKDAMLRGANIYNYIPKPEDHLLPDEDIDNSDHDYAKYIIRCLLWQFTQLIMPPQGRHFNWMGPPDVPRANADTEDLELRISSTTSSSTSRRQLHLSHCDRRLR